VREVCTGRVAEASGERLCFRVRHPRARDLLELEIAAAEIEQRSYLVLERVAATEAIASFLVTSLTREHTTFVEEEFSSEKQVVEEELLLVTYRLEYQHGWSSKTFYSQLRLDPLRVNSAAQLLEALLGNEPELTPLSPPAGTQQASLLMGIRVALHHTTHYTYDRPVQLRRPRQPQSACGRGS